MKNFNKEELEIMFTALHLLAQQQGANAVTNDNFVSVSKKVASEITSRKELEKESSKKDKK